MIAAPILRHVTSLTLAADEDDLVLMAAEPLLLLLVVEWCVLVTTVGSGTAGTAALAAAFVT